MDEKTIFSALKMANNVNITPSTGFKTYVFKNIV